VLFGEQGLERVAYEVDAVQDALGIVLEIEAGRGAQSNAVYRDLIRSSLLVEARFFALGVMSRYRFQSAGRTTEVRSYEAARNIFDAIYASGRLKLPRPRFRSPAGARPLRGRALHQQVGPQ
jgi:hypothetical protein